MSYDLEILAKIESGDYICITEPRYSSPTYNLGKMFRIAMDWDFDQGTIYNVADILDNIKRGISELEQYPEKYVQYEPENRWGTVSDALEVLKSFCYQCNFYKSTLLLEEFREQMSTLHERISKPFIARLGLDYGIIEIKPFNGKFYFEEET